MSRSTTDLDGKVRDIVNSYRSIEIVHPTLSNMFQSPEFKQAFLNSLTQDLHVIRQRSPNLIDGEISIVQKAFTILMEHEEDAVPAVELYVEEILGLRFVSEEDRFQTISIVVGTRDSLSTSDHPRLPPDQA